MKIICSWCRGEGHVGFVGEKAPLEDRRETHGICLEHQRTMRRGISAPLYQTMGVDRSGASTDENQEVMWLTHLYRLTLSIVHLRAGLKHLASKSRR